MKNTKELNILCGYPTDRWSYNEGEFFSIVVCLLLFMDHHPGSMMSCSKNIPQLFHKHKMSEIFVCEKWCLKTSISLAKLGEFFL